MELFVQQTIRFFSIQQIYYTWKEHVYIFIFYTELQAYKYRKEHVYIFIFYTEYLHGIYSFHDFIDFLLKVNEYWNNICGLTFFLLTFDLKNGYIKMNCFCFTYYYLVQCINPTELKYCSFMYILDLFCSYKNLTCFNYKFYYKNIMGLEGDIQYQQSWMCRIYEAAKK